MDEKCVIWKREKNVIEIAIIYLNLVLLFYVT